MQEVILFILFLFSNVCCLNVTKLFEDAMLIDDMIWNSQYNSSYNLIVSTYNSTCLLQNKSSSDIFSYEDLSSCNNNSPAFRDFDNFVGMMLVKNFHMCDALIREPAFNKKLDDTVVYENYPKPWASSFGRVLNAIFYLFGESKFKSYQKGLVKFIEYFNNDTTVDYTTFKYKLDKKVKQLMINYSKNIQQGTKHIAQKTVLMPYLAKNLSSLVIVHPPNMQINKKPSDQHVAVLISPIVGKLPQIKFNGSVSQLKKPIITQKYNTTIVSNKNTNKFIPSVKQTNFIPVKQTNKTAQDSSVKPMNAIISMIDKTEVSPIKHPIVEISKLPQKNFNGSQVKRPITIQNSNKTLSSNKNTNKLTPSVKQINGGVISGKVPTIKQTNAAIPPGKQPNKVLPSVSLVNKTVPTNPFVGKLPQIKLNGSVSQVKKPIITQKSNTTVSSNKNTNKFIPAVKQTNGVPGKVPTTKRINTTVLPVKPSNIVPIVKPTIISPVNREVHVNNLKTSTASSKLKVIQPVTNKHIVPSIKQNDYTKPKIIPVVNRTSKVKGIISTTFRSKINQSVNKVQVSNLNKTFIVNKPKLVANPKNVSGWALLSKNLDLRPTIKTPILIPNTEKQKVVTQTTVIPNSVLHPGKQSKVVESTIRPVITPRKNVKLVKHVNPTIKKSNSLPSKIDGINKGDKRNIITLRSENLILDSKHLSELNLKKIIVKKFLEKIFNATNSRM